MSPIRPPTTLEAPIFSKGYGSLTNKVGLPGAGGRFLTKLCIFNHPRKLERLLLLDAEAKTAGEAVPVVGKGHLSVIPASLRAIARLRAIS